MKTICELDNTAAVRAISEGRATLRRLQTVPLTECVTVPRALTVFEFIEPLATIRERTYVPIEPIFAKFQASGRTEFTAREFQSFAEAHGYNTGGNYINNFCSRRKKAGGLTVLRKTGRAFVFGFHSSTPEL